MAQDPVRRLTAVVAGMGGTQRESQADMVRAVAVAIEEGSVLLVQAGTGTGKSLGYLVPAVAAAATRDHVVVVATATLALQRQLLTKDLPAVLAALPADEQVDVAVLKGRGNYLCRARLAGDGGDDGQEELGLGVREGRLERQAAQLRAWAAQTDTGDRDDYAHDVDDRVWRSLSATGRQCVGPSKCPYAGECFSELARARAAAADLVVTNHALLALDAIDGTPVVPEHDVLVVDEAHELTSRATAAATGELSVRDAERALTLARKAVPGERLESLTEAVAGFADALEDLGPGQQAVPSALVEPLAALRDSCHVALSAIPRDGDLDTPARHRIQAALEDVHDVAGRILAAGDDHVTWCTPTSAPTVHVAPLSVAGLVGSYLAERGAAVLTSATLTLGGDFEAAAADLGLPHGGWQGRDVGSPFAYGSQAILYVAADLPRPGRDGPDVAVTDRVRALIEAAGGRTMVLLSSWRAVDAVAAALLADPSAGVRVLVQRRGEPVARLVADFADDETSVLVGTMSLFQGVDVAGDSCVCVVIDKIPFPRPDDPVLSARAERVARAGGNGFMAVSVPRAALLLAQGTGRLIRSTSDRGVVAVLDPRLATARYGTFLRRSLPPFWTTTDLDVALGALRRLTAAAAR